MKYYFFFFFLNIHKEEAIWRKEIELRIVLKEHRCLVNNDSVNQLIEVFPQERD